VKPNSIAVLICAFIAAPVFADDSHHPETSAAATTVKPPVASATPPAAERAGPSHSASMAHMHAMMERMHQAASAEERTKIMEEHKASMGRDMMGGHGSHAPAGK
jgi:hypothetical protein